MKVKPVVPREQASRDVDEAIASYLSESSEQAAMGFVDALEQDDDVQKVFHNLK